MAKYEIAFDDKREEVGVYLVRNGSCFTNPPEVIQLEPTPYIKPDIELLADEAHGIGFSEGYEQGIKQGRKEMREAVIKLADVSTRICAFDGGSIEYIFRAYKPEVILNELARFDKQKFDKDLSTLVEQYGYDGVTDVLRKMIESEKE